MNASSTRPTVARTIPVITTVLTPRRAMSCWAPIDATTMPTVMGRKARPASTGVNPSTSCT